MVWNDLNGYYNMITRLLCWRDGIRSLFYVFS
jgi:hypothetical protein